jgi:hypothetical protein
MAQFNANKAKIKARTITTNKAGGKAFKPSEELEFILRASTTVAKMDTFYEGGEASNRRLVELARTVDPELAFKTAYFTRNVANMRTSATVILAEAAYAGAKDIENGSIYVDKSIRRVDDMTELLAYCMMLNKKNGMTGSDRMYLPMVLKRGIKKAFNKFDAYQFAKYTKDEKEYNPRDVMFFTHPKPRDGQEEMFQQIVDDTLPLPETWENYIMVNGSTKKNWTYILDQMGYLGIIRNLRNLMKHGVDTGDICAEVADLNRVHNSRMLPIQFYTAYRQVEKTNYAGVGQVKAALSDAMLMSAGNMALLPGKTAVFCDNSGSMEESINPKSTVTYADIGNVFGAMVAARCENSLVLAFGTDVVNPNLNPRDSILTNVDKISRAGDKLRNNTYMYKCINYLDARMPDVDRILIFTDEQGYGVHSCYDALNQFRKKHGVNPYVYTFDIKHYGTTTFPENERRHCTVGGWSDNILNFANLFEQDGTTLVDQVKNIDITAVR